MGNKHPGQPQASCCLIRRGREFTRACVYGGTLLVGTDLLLISRCCTSHRLVVATYLIMFSNVELHYICSGGGVYCSHLMSKVDPSTYSIRLHLGYFSDAFIQSNLQRFIHTFTHRRRSQPRKALASSSGAVRVRSLARGHFDTQLGGAGNCTRNLPVTTEPTLPLELSRPFPMSGLTVGPLFTMRGVICSALVTWYPVSRGNVRGEQNNVVGPHY